MSKTEILFQFALYVVPAIVFFGAVYFFTNKWVTVQREKNQLQALSNKQKPISKSAELQKHIFPLQVEAYQRLVLFLERIDPNNLIMRLNNPGLPAKAFQQKILETVRQEYEHNLAQQIFVSPEAWAHVKSTKEEVVKIVNMSATKLEPTALANDLSKGVFEIVAQLSSQPTEPAINFLKSELNQKLNS